MIRVLLVHSRKIPHYRISIFSYLAKYLRKHGYELIVLSGGMQRDNSDCVEFPYIQKPVGLKSVLQCVKRLHADVVIMFVRMRCWYLFPVYIAVKGILERPIIYWGQGRDLLDPEATLKNLVYITELALANAIVLYGEALKRYVPVRFHAKTFVANNTLVLKYSGLAKSSRSKVRQEFGIKTERNIICVGRMQKRKRIDHLIAAYRLLNRCDVGLILAGPDPEGVLQEYNGNNIYKVGQVYGSKKYDLLSASDVFCIPGAIGLSIVDAFFCGLPAVTEEGYDSAEMMYLKDGINGFVVPNGNVPALAEKLLILLDDENLRNRFSAAAQKEIAVNGDIDKMCSGFLNALYYVSGPP